MSPSSTHSDPGAVLGAVVAAADPSARGPQRAAEFRAHRDQLAACTDSELVERLNQQVGRNGWVTARADYLWLLTREIERPFDTSGIDGMPGRRRFRLDGHKLTYADNTPP